MSHKTELKVNIDNKKALMDALTEMGFTVTDEKRKLAAFSWTMDTDITVKKDGRLINVGFKQQEDGTFTCQHDFYGTSISVGDFQKNLNTLHGKHKVANWLNENRYQVTYERDEDGDLVVVGSKWN
jgi:uncharacterized membrane protein YfhO